MIEDFLEVAEGSHNTVNNVFHDLKENNCQSNNAYSNIAFNKEDEHIFGICYKTKQKKKSVFRSRLS